MLSKYFIINDNDCCCREKEPIACPICGRFHNFNYLEGYWCPYCGVDRSGQMLTKIYKLTGRVDIIEKLLQWGTQLQEEEEKQEGE